ADDDYRAVSGGLDARYGRIPVPPALVRPHVRYAVVLRAVADPGADDVCQIPHRAPAWRRRVPPVQLGPAIFRKVRKPVAPRDAWLLAAARMGAGPPAPGVGGGGSAVLGLPQSGLGHWPRVLSSGGRRPAHALCAGSIRDRPGGNRTARRPGGEISQTTYPGR